MNNFLTRRFAIPAWLLVLIAIGAILAAVLRITIPDYLWILIALLLILIGLLPFLSPPPSKELQGLDGHTITVSHYTEESSPELREMSPEQVDNARQYSRDGVEEILSIAGDLVFYDQRNRESFVTSFAKPVRVTIRFTEKERDAYLRRRDELLASGTIRSREESKLMPIYLYSYPLREPQVNIWKPFQNYELDLDKLTMSVDVQFWGDQNIGVGTKP